MILRDMSYVLKRIPSEALFEFFQLLTKECFKLGIIIPRILIVFEASITFDLRDESLNNGINSWRNATSGLYNEGEYIFSKY